MVGQPVALVAAAVAMAWWLADRKRPVLAGLALSLIAIKPQLALLVPLCLLVSGHRRIFVVWLAATAGMAAAGVGLLGAGGIHRFPVVLAQAHVYDPPRRTLIACRLVAV